MIRKVNKKYPLVDFYQKDILKVMYKEYILNELKKTENSIEDARKNVLKQISKCDYITLANFKNESLNALEDEFNNSRKIIINKYNEAILNEVINEKTRDNKYTEMVELESKEVRIQEKFIQTIIEELKEKLKNQDISDTLKNVINKKINMTIEELKNLYGGYKITELMGLGEYAVQLGKYIKILEGEEENISSNFFPNKNHLFDNANIFLYGWQVEGYAVDNLKKEYQNKNIKTVEFQEWGLLTEQLSKAKLWMNQKRSIIYKNKKNLSDEDFNYNIKLLNEIEKNVKEELKTMFTNSKNIEDLKKNYEKLILEVDNIYSNDNILDKLKSKDKIDFNFRNFGYTFREYNQRIDKYIALSNKEGFNSLKERHKKLLKEYFYNKNIPIVDIVIGDFEELIEIKTAKVTKGNLKLPLYLSRKMKEGFDKVSYKREFIKKNQEEFFDRNITKLNKSINLLGLEGGQEKIKYYFKLMDLEDGTNKELFLSLEELNKIYLEDNFLDNTYIKGYKGDINKMGLTINKDFFLNYFKDFKYTPNIVPNKEADKTNKEQQLR